MIQGVSVDAGYKNVFVAVVIVVADGHSDVITRTGEPGFFGYVLEVAVAIVFKETIRVLRGTLAKGLDVGAVGEENIQLAIIVVVKNGDPAGHGLGRVTLRSFVGFELKSDRLIVEMNGASWGLFLRLGESR